MNHDHDPFSLTFSQFLTNQTERKTFDKNNHRKKTQKQKQKSGVGAGRKKESKSTSGFNHLEEAMLNLWNKTKRRK